MRDAIILIFANKQDLPDGECFVKFVGFFYLLTLRCVRLYSHEAARDPGEARPHPNKRSQLVRAAVVRHHRWRPVRGPNMAHVQPQVMRINVVLERTPHHNPWAINPRLERVSRAQGIWAMRTYGTAIVWITNNIQILNKTTEIETDWGTSDEATTTNNIHTRDTQNLRRNKVRCCFDCVDPRSQHKIITNHKTVGNLRRIWSRDFITHLHPIIGTKTPEEVKKKIRKKNN